jgi:glycerol-3-phosphate dehydrogenase (NAD(P)+)
MGRPLADVLSETTMVAEGVKTASTAMELAARHGIEMPICRVIQRVIGGTMTATEAYRGLRHAGQESDPG